MLFSRVASLVVGQEGGKGVELAGLRIAFSIEKGAIKNPNDCTVRVWNASPSSRKVMEVIGNVVILKAGYNEDIGAATIFTGNVTRSLTLREGPDWVTEIELQDGFLEFRDTKVSLSFASGVTTLQVIKSLASKFGLPVRPLPTDIADRQYVSGFAFVGRVRDAMDKACDYMGLEWSIQNREIQVIRKGGVFKQRAYLLSSETGMLGSPEQESKTMTEKAAAKQGITRNQPGVKTTTKRDKDGEQQERLKVLGYKVNTLLQPLIEPGGLVQLRTKSIKDELFRVEALVHVGDTHASEWMTQLVLRYADV